MGDIPAASRGRTPSLAGLRPAAVSRSESVWSGGRVVDAGRGPSFRAVWGRSARWGYEYVDRGGVVLDARLAHFLGGDMGDDLYEYELTAAH